MYAQQAAAQADTLNPYSAANLNPSGMKANSKYKGPSRGRTTVDRGSEYDMRVWGGTSRASGKKRTGGKVVTRKVSIVARSHKGAAKGEKFTACAHQAGTAKKRKVCATGSTAKSASAKALKKFHLKK
jgi:hypothetical protein